MDGVLLKCFERQLTLSQFRLSLNEFRSFFWYHCPTAKAIVRLFSVEASTNKLEKVIVFTVESLQPLRCNNANIGSIHV